MPRCTYFQSKGEQLLGTATVQRLLLLIVVCCLLPASCPLLLVARLVFAIACHFANRGVYTTYGTTIPRVKGGKGQTQPAYKPHPA